MGWHFTTGDGSDVTSGHFEGNDLSARVLLKLGFAYLGDAMLSCRARGTDVPSRRMILTRAAWQAIAPTA